MPPVNVTFYKEDTKIPALEFFDQIPKKAAAKGTVRLERLAELGHEMRRPEADLLRDGIYELRWQSQGINYRVLYFFHGKGIVVLSHGITKQQAEVPTHEINLAIQRKTNFQSDPEGHTYYEE